MYNKVKSQWKITFLENFKTMNTLINQEWIYIYIYIYIQYIDRKVPIQDYLVDIDLPSATWKMLTAAGMNKQNC